jgi:hypothetical protein
MIIYAILGLRTTQKLHVNTKYNGVEIIVLNRPITDKKDIMEIYARKFYHK